MTSTWHAYASRDMLAAGTEILVTGGHERIRIQTADQISIEMPDRNRLSALVVERIAFGSMGHAGLDRCSARIGRSTEPRPGQRAPAAGTHA